MSPRIMISYRRSDTAGIAGRIFDRLRAHFGSGAVFMDVDTIPVGVDFRTFIEDAMNAIDVVVAIVGRDWHTPSETGVNRLLDVEDPVRLELETAISKSLRIVPVLVEGASMPSKSVFPPSLQHVAFLNAATVSTGVDFDHHISRLLRVLEGEERENSSRFDGLAVPGGNLPKALSAILGRELDLERLATLIDEHDLVTITGPGGIGKTRLALAVAAPFEIARVGGARLVDLAPIRSPDLIAGRIASTLGMSEYPGRSALENVIAHLRHREVLLVIDNCEHVIDEATLVIDDILRNCRDVKIVATSREALGIIGERVFAVGPLAAPPRELVLDVARAGEFSAVALFFERASAVNPQFRIDDDTAGIVGEICRRLDGIALAVELAAARVTMFDVRTINDRLRERFDVLTEGSRTAAQRQQTMRATIDWSFDLLSVQERSAFTALGIFADGWSLEAAEAVCADSQSEKKLTVAHLSSLVRKSLVVVEFRRNRTRYRFLDSTRAYALEKGAQSSPVFLRRLLAWIDAFTTTFASERETTARASLEEVMGELANIRYALGAAIESDEDAGTAATLIHRLAISMFWYDAGIESEGRHWLELALERAERSGDALLTGKLWGAFAGISVGREAVDAGTKAVSVLEASGEPDECARAHTALALGLFQLGSLKEADVAAGTALSIYEQHDLADRRAYADALAVRAQIFQHRDLHEEARNAFARSIQLFENGRGGQGAASARGNLAELEFFCGDARLALSLVNEATLVFREAGATSREATALVNAATYHLALDEIDEAHEKSLAALRLARGNHDTPIITVAIQNIAAVRAQCGDFVSSARLLGYVDAWYRREGYERQWSERRVEKLVSEALANASCSEDLAEQRVAGLSLSEEDAISEATCAGR